MNQRPPSDLQIDDVRQMLPSLTTPRLRNVPSPAIGATMSSLLLALNENIRPGSKGLLPLGFGAQGILWLHCSLACVQTTVRCTRRPTGEDYHGQGPTSSSLRMIGKVFLLLDGFRRQHWGARGVLTGAARST